MKPSLFVISLLSGFVFPAFAQQIDDAYLASLIKDVKQAVSMQSATAIAVVQGDKIIFEHYDGYIDIEGERPAGPDSLFYIASVTKPFTALNALLDEHNNRISLNTKLVEMLPNSTLTSRHNVTVQQLLTHTGSIDNPSLVLATAYSGVHTPETLRKIAGQLSTESEEAVGDFRYTNVGYNLYSIYSNARFDSSWQDKLAAEVFGPAGMSHTSAAFSAIENKASIAKPYTLWPNGRETALAFQKSDKTMHAAGGVYTTATDLGRFLIAQLNHGLLEQKQVYPAQVIAKSHQKQAVTDSSYLDFKRSGYAYGWYVGSYKEQQLLFHFGGFAGAHAHLSLAMFC